MSTPQLYTLDDALLVHVLSFAVARDVEAIAMASRLIALHLLPQYPEIWRHLFVRRWEQLNYRLNAVTENADNLVLDKHLRALFPLECTESRNFQLLSRAITTIPSSMDIRKTEHSPGYSEMQHRIVPLEQKTSGTAFTFGGERFGSNRSVRTNVPIPTSFYIAVLKRRVRDESSRNESISYQIGVTTSAYFEITMTEPVSQSNVHSTRNEGLEMTAIGLVTAAFPLVGKQPGWTTLSYGYHGDNGKLYSPVPGKPSGPRFGVNDTVGCGVRSCTQNNHRRVFFTHNGTNVSFQGRSHYILCDNHFEWYPTVGLDSRNTVFVNFGQEQFENSHIIDELFGECVGENAVSALRLLQDARRQDACECYL